MKYRVCLITVCWNEQMVLPWVIDYWKQYATHVVVYDNDSTDDTIPILQQHDWIEVRRYDSGGKKDNDSISALKNDCWRLFRQYDFLCVTDLDEVFFFPNGPDVVLDQMKAGGYNFLGAHQYGLCEDAVPPYAPGRLLHENCKKFFRQKMNDMPGYTHLTKFTLFDPSLVTRTGWSVGQHLTKAKPELRVMEVPESECVAVHINSGFGWKYKWYRNQLQRVRLSSRNVKRGYSFQYYYGMKRVKQEYEEWQRSGGDWNWVMNGGREL